MQTIDARLRSLFNHFENWFWLLFRRIGKWYDSKLDYVEENVIARVRYPLAVAAAVKRISSSNMQLLIIILSFHLRLIYSKLASPTNAFAAIVFNFAKAHDAQIISCWLNFVLVAQTVVWPKKELRWLAAAATQFDSQI